MVDLSVVAIVISTIALIATVPFWIRVLIHAFYNPEMKVYLGKEEEIWLESTVDWTKIGHFPDLTLHIVNKSAYSLNYQIEYVIDGPAKINFSNGSPNNSSDHLNSGSPWNSSYSIKIGSSHQEGSSNSQILKEINDIKTNIGQLFEKLNDVERQVKRASAIDKHSYPGQDLRIVTDENLVSRNEHKKFELPFLPQTVSDLHIEVHIRRKVELSQLYLPEFFGVVDLKPVNKDFYILD